MSLGPAGVGLNPEDAENFEDVCLVQEEKNVRY